MPWDKLSPIYEMIYNESDVKLEFCLKVRKWCINEVQWLLRYAVIRNIGKDSDFIETLLLTWHEYFFNPAKNEIQQIFTKSNTI